jgi:LEA14-like dessication related protein
MKLGTVALIATIGAGAIYLSNLGIAANTTTIIFSGVQIKSITDFMLSFMIQNVSNATIQFNSMTGMVSVNGSQLGNISTFQAVTIPGNSQQQVNIEFQPSLLSIPGTVMSFIQSPGSTLDFNIQGNANVNSLVLPFNLDQTITI